jgi:hypothetical protein
MCTFSSATGISAWISAMRVSKSGAAVAGTGTMPMWFLFPRICRTLRAMGGDLLE